jgi:dihydroflavonol-4-reductase
VKLCSQSVRPLHTMPAMDHRKAERELDWQPKLVHDAIRCAAVFYPEQRRDR